MAGPTQQFDLSKFKKNPDGSYSKISTAAQPRDTHKLSGAGKSDIKEHAYNIDGVQTTMLQYLPFSEPTSAKKPKRKLVLIQPTYWKGKNIKDVFAEATENNFIFIPHNVPSSKNSKRAYKGIVMESKLCVEYRKNTKIHWQVFKHRFKQLLEGKEKPYRIEMMFIRDSARKSDYHNICQLPFDLMTKFEWIADDNMDEVVAVPPLKPYALDKHIPGVIIRVL